MQEDDRCGNRLSEYPNLLHHSESGVPPEGHRTPAPVPTPLLRVPDSRGLGFCDRLPLLHEVQSTSQGYVQPQKSASHFRTVVCVATQPLQSGINFCVISLPPVSTNLEPHTYFQE
uniref:Uncharacterized protein n=1 Tax=Anguilla anguilla TaxID=7936 RepID=A0A0E9XIT5_ANGAN